MFDGIIVSTTAGNFISLAEFDNFLKRFDPTPIVFFGPGPTHYHQILVNNQQGMEEIVLHFLHDHQYKKIAFITGPEGNKDAEERLRAYKSKLEEAGIRIDPELIYTGDFTYDAGVSAVNVLLDERQVKFDALIASNDNMALGAKAELERRGYIIPDQVALAGFDDIIEASSVLPSITTARQPFELFGKKIIEQFLNIFKGEKAQKI
jgi:DNA-binding LacI/PurR family transcriptional regulator